MRRKLTRWNLKTTIWPHLKRRWHPFNRWEEIAHNMWGDVSDHRAALQEAIEFTGNHKLYGRYMMRVVNEWPVSCENALTDRNLNRKAWIGHAACALAMRCPEDIVRKAWGFLTDGQRTLANKEAARAIRFWEITYCKDRSLLEDLDGPLLSWRDT